MTPGILGGQGRSASSLAWASSVVLYAAVAFGVLAVYGALRAAGVL